MTTKTVEQKGIAEEPQENAEEQKADISGTEEKPGVSKARKPGVSKAEKPGVSTEGKVTKPKYTEEQLNSEADKRAETRAQAMKDKELKSFQGEIIAANKRIEDLVQSAEDAKSDSALQRQEASEAEEMGESPALRSFHTERRRVDALQKEVKRTLKLIEDSRDEIAEQTQNVQATEHAIRAILPELGDLLDGFIKELKEGTDSPTAMKYLAQLKGGEYREKLVALITKGQGEPEEGEEEEEGAPDSSSHSAAGGKDFSSMNAAEKVTASLNKLRKKQKGG